MELNLSIVCPKCKGSKFEICDDCETFKHWAEKTKTKKQLSSYLECTHHGCYCRVCGGVGEVLTENGTKLLDFFNKFIFNKLNNTISESLKAIKKNF